MLHSNASKDTTVSQLGFIASRHNLTFDGLHASDYFGLDVDSGTVVFTLCKNAPDLQEVTMPRVQAMIKSLQAAALVKKNTGLSLVHPLLHDRDNSPVAPVADRQDALAELGESVVCRDMGHALEIEVHFTKQGDELRDALKEMAAQHYRTLGTEIGLAHSVSASSFRDGWAGGHTSVAR